MKKLLLLLCILISVNFISCGHSSEEYKELETTASKENNNELSNTERYYYILNTKQSYQDLKEESNGLNVIFMDKLIDGDVEYDAKYEERVNELRNQRDNSIFSESKDKNEDIYDESVSNNKFKDVKISDNIAKSVQEVNDKVMKEIDSSKRFKKYKISMAADSVTIKFGDKINLNDVNKEALSNIASNIYGYFKESGLANSEEGPVQLHVYFIINNNKFSSSWSLDKNQVDDWRN